MTSLQSRFVPFLAIVVLTGIIFGFSYLTVTREMGLLIPALGGLIGLIIVFFNIKLSIVLLLMAMLLSPEIEIAKTAAREITIRLEDALLGIMTVGWILRMAVIKDIGFVRKNPLNFPIVLYCLIAIIATALGVLRGNVNPLGGFFFVLKFIEYFFIYFVIVNHISEQSEIETLFNILFYTAAIVCITGVLQVVAGATREVSLPFEGAEGERNTLGGYLALMLSICGGILFHDKKGKDKIFIGILSATMLIILLLSDSRSGLMALGAGVFMLFLNAGKIHYFIIGVLILAMLYPFIIPEATQERLAYTFTQEEWHGEQLKIFGITLDTSSTARIMTYIKALQKIGRRPFFGYGVTGAFFIDGQFFRTLAETGILGLASLVFLLFSAQRQFSKTIKNAYSTRIRALAYGCNAGFWSVIAHAITANTFIIVRIAEPFWCVTALMVAYNINKDSYKPEIVEKESLENVSAEIRKYYT